MGDCECRLGIICDMHEARYEANDLREQVDTLRAELEQVQGEKDDLAGECDRVGDALRGSGVTDGVLLSVAVCTLRTQRDAAIARAEQAEREVGQIRNTVVPDLERRYNDWMQRAIAAEKERDDNAAAASIHAEEHRNVRHQRDALRGEVEKWKGDSLGWQTVAEENGRDARIHLAEAARLRGAIERWVRAGAALQERGKYGLPELQAAAEDLTAALTPAPGEAPACTCTPDTPGDRRCDDLVARCPAGMAAVVRAHTTPAEAGEVEVFTREYLGDWPAKKLTCEDLERFCKETEDPKPPRCIGCDHKPHRGGDCSGCFCIVDNEARQP